MDLYQSLVTVNPVTLIAQICNLFIQLLIVKIFFLDKIKAVLDKRRETADKQIADAEAAKSEAAAIKQTYEENMRQAKTKADDMILSAQKAASDIEMEKKKAINEAKNEISELAMAIAGKVVARELNDADQDGMIDRFIEELGDQK